MTELKELFNECTKDITGEVSKQIKFTYVVGKENRANLLECRKTLGYYSDDEKEDNALAAQFRNKVLHPLRDHLTCKLFNLSKKDAAALWARSAKSEENDAKRKRVLDLLPARTRRTTDKNDIESIIGDVEI
jgi:hypothetical protein